LNYVKFLRLSPDEFSKLLHLDNDTLYFVYKEDETVAELYLGNKLISGGDIISDEGASYLSNLKDIALCEIQDRDALIYSELY
jgi:hypothetical protein